MHRVLFAFMHEKSMREKQTRIGTWKAKNRVGPLESEKKGNDENELFLIFSICPYFFEEGRARESFDSNGKSIFSREKCVYEME